MEREFYKSMIELFKTLTCWRSAQSLIKCSSVSSPCKYRNNRQASRTCFILSKTTLACLILNAANDLSPQKHFSGVSSAFYVRARQFTPCAWWSNNFVGRIGNGICLSCLLLSPSHLPRAHNPSASLINNQWVETTWGRLSSLCMLSLNFFFFGLVLLVTGLRLLCLV